MRGFRGINGGMSARVNPGRATLSTGLYGLNEAALGYPSGVAAETTDPLIASVALLMQVPASTDPYTTDATGKALTFSGAVAPVIDPDFPAGGALEFGAGGGKVTLASDATFASGTGGWAVEALVKLSAMPTGYQCIYATRPDTGGYSDAVYFGVGPAGITLYSNAFLVGPAGLPSSVSATPIPLGSVVRLLARRHQPKSGADVLTLAINETVVATATTSQSWTRTVPSVGALGSGAEAFVGRLGALRVTNAPRSILRPTAPWPTV